MPSARDTLLVAAGVVLAVAGSRLPLALREPDPAGPLPVAAAGGLDVAWLPDTVKRWRQPIEQMSRKYNVDPDLVGIIMTLESGGAPKARSEAGAVGLMQVTPPTAGDIARKHVAEKRADYNLEDPRTSIEFGAAYLAYLRDEFGEPDQAPTWNGTVELVAAGYNGGPGSAGALYKGEGLHDMETVTYSRDAYNMWRERHADSSPTYERWLERGGSRLVERAKAE